MAEGLPIVFVPGLLCTARLYKPQVPVFWCRGPVMLADHTRDDTGSAIAARILRDAPPSFALVGLSMGGYIALETVRQAPERVAKLALLDTNARPDTPEQSERRTRLIEMAERGQFSGIAELMIPAFLHKAHQQDPELRRIIKVMADETGPAAFVRQQRAIMTRPDFAAAAAGDLLPKPGAGRGGRRTHPAGAVAGDCRRHSRCAPGDRARLRASLHAGAAGPGEHGAPRMARGVRRMRA